jgi:hypothetical protein
MPDANGLLAEWLDRLWTLTWGSVVLATGLLAVGVIESGQWLLVWQLAFGGFTSVRLIEAAGSAVATARTANKE